MVLLLFGVLIMLSSFWSSLSKGEITIDQIVCFLGMYVWTHDCCVCIYVHVPYALLVCVFGNCCFIIFFQLKVPDLKNLPIKEETAEYFATLTTLDDGGSPQVGSYFMAFTLHGFHTSWLSAYVSHCSCYQPESELIYNLILTNCKLVFWLSREQGKTFLDVVHLHLLWVHAWYNCWHWMFV